MQFFSRKNIFHMKSENFGQNTAILQIISSMQYSIHFNESLFNFVIP